MAQTTTTGPLVKATETGQPHVPLNQTRVTEEDCISPEPIPQAFPHLGGSEAGEGGVCNSWPPDGEGGAGRNGNDDMAVDMDSGRVPMDIGKVMHSDH